MIRKCSVILIHWLLWLCIITNLFILNLERVVEHCYKLCAASVLFLRKKINTACCMHHPLDLLFSMILYILLLWNISWMNSFDWRVVLSWDATALTAIFYVMINLDMFSEKEARFDLLLSYVLLTTKPRWKDHSLCCSFLIKQWYIDKITATNVATKTLVIIS